MDTNLEILKNSEARAELIRACQHVAELVQEAGLRVIVGREPFDIDLTADDLLAAAEDARDQLVEHLIDPIDQPPPRGDTPVRPDDPATEHFNEETGAW